ncbi:MAG: MgtC/SapB family protein [PVC group bacterium]|nr:MgtC/SapB family protein [PVC group bacterium]
MMTVDNITPIFLRLILAAFLSGLIGYERELHGRAAGLRTTILVGVGSCLMMITSMHIQEMYRGIAVVDPARIAAQVVSGIGFLGAGTILRFRASVRGLTTAAGLWAVAGIGLAVGSGFYSAALISTAVIYIVLVTLSRVERKIKKEIYKVLRIKLSDGESSRSGIKKLDKISKILTHHQIEIKDLEIDHSDKDGDFGVSLQVWLSNANIISRVTEAVLKIEGIIAIKWE